MISIFSKNKVVLATLLLLSLAAINNSFASDDGKDPSTLATNNIDKDEENQMLNYNENNQSTNESSSDVLAKVNEKLSFERVDLLSNCADIIDLVVGTAIQEGCINKNAAPYVGVVTAAVPCSVKCTKCFTSVPWQHFPNFPFRPEEIRRGTLLGIEGLLQCVKVSWGVCLLCGSESTFGTIKNYNFFSNVIDGCILFISQIRTYYYPQKRT